MNQNSRLLLAALACGLLITTAQRSFAQSASESFHKAGESAENAGSSTGDAAVHAYHGTVTATKDTAITTDIKTKLLADESTKAFHIHVKTVAGVVTLRGRVNSQAAADRAAQVATTTDGVKRVRNRLRVEVPRGAAD